MAITAHGGLGDSDEPAHGRLGDRPLRHGDGPRVADDPRPHASIAQLAVSGTFDRIPELRIYLAETNASWMPAVFFMMDDSYELFRDWYGVHLEMKPSEYARRNLRFGIVRDPLALADARLPPGRGPRCGDPTSRTR